eukprot:g2299.t1
MSDTNTRAKVQEQPAQQQGENQDKDQDLELALPVASVIATSTMIPKPSTLIFTLVGCVLFLVFGGIFVGALIDYISTPREKSWSQLPDLTVVDHKPKASPTSDVDLIYMVVFGVLAFTTALVFPLIYMAVRSRRKALFHMQELVDNGQALTIFAGDLQWTSYISMVDGFYALTIDWFQAGKNNQESKSFRVPVPKDKLELVDRQLRDWPLFHYKGIVA